jgi:hypothetical protein
MVDGPALPQKMEGGVIQRLPNPGEQPSMMDYQNAKAFLNHQISEIESALICEIEKIEGKVPAPKELSRFGIQRFDKVTGFTHYLWKDVLLLTVKPNQCRDGKRGTLLEIHKVIEPGNLDVGSGDDIAP